MKKKVLLSSIATIALCLCLIAGSTFALFTSNSDFNISVTSGDVEILATAGISGVYSAEGTDGDAEDKYLIDENHYNYSHAPQTLETDAEGNVVKGIFSNGGDAVIDGANLVIDRITPGDRVDVDINVQNLSNVAISYRYKIEANDTLLAKGMVVTIDDKSYGSLASWTSEWFTLDASNGVAEQIADADAKTISVELPVYARNEYEKQTVEYTILVEAVQGNAVTENEASVVVYPTFNAVQDALENDEPLVILEGEGDIDLDNIVVDKGVYSTGNVTIKNGKIDVEAAGFENVGGEAELNDMTFEAGSPADYGVISRGDSETVLNNTVITSGGGAVAAAGGAQVTFNSGSVEVDSASTSGRYLFYAEGEGSVITINGGSFDFNKTQNQKRAYICAMAGSTVYVTGGTFGKASTRSGYTAGILTPPDSKGILPDGKVVITGGTFGFDPSAWMPAGYVADYDTTNKTWTVYFPQSSFDDLINNAAAGATVEVPAGNFLLSGNNDIVIVGSGEKTVIDIDGNIQNAHISNVTITGNNSFNVQERNTIVFENVVFDGNVGMTAQGVVKGNATFKNCTFKAGFHIDQSLDTVNVVFEGCTFGELGYIKLGGSANYSMIDCTIETLDSSASGPWGKQWIISYSDISFTNCKIGRVIRAGGAITITLDSCVDTNNVAVSEAIVHTYNAPTVVIK